MRLYNFKIFYLNYQITIINLYGKFRIFFFPILRGEIPVWQATLFISSLGMGCVQTRVYLCLYTRLYVNSNTFLVLFLLEGRKWRYMGCRSLLAWALDCCLLMI